MKKIDEKKIVLTIFEKSDGGKAYVLERDGFYELREGKEESFWKNFDIIEEEDSFLSKRRKLSLSVELFKKKAPLGPVPEAKEIYFVDCYIKEIPFSFTMDEAIKMIEEKSGKKRFIKIPKKDGKTVYILEKDGFWALRDGDEISFWRDENHYFLSDGIMQVVLSEETSSEGIPLGRVEVTRDYKEILGKRHIITEVPESFTIDEAIREYGGKAHKETMKGLKISESAFDDFYESMTGGLGSYKKVVDSITGKGKDTPVGTVCVTSSEDSEPFTTKTLSKDELVYISTATCATGGLKVGGVEAVEPIYAESFLPHLVRAKDEGVRRDIEADTIVIDRGVAVSQGLIREEDGKRKHADVIMGLKVRYAKEGILPMDSAFVIFKEKGAKDKKKAEEEKTAEVAEKSDKDAIKDDCRALGTINREDLKDMGVEELFILEENLRRALKVISEDRIEKLCAFKSMLDAYEKKAEFIDTKEELELTVLEAEETAKEKIIKDKEKAMREASKKTAADAIEPTPYDLLSSVKIDPVLWKKGLSSDIMESTEVTKKMKESMESEKSRAIKRGSVYIPMENVSGDIPEELICRSPDHAEEIEVKFTDVSKVKKVFREWASGDEKESTTPQPEEWLIYVKVYHEDDLDECILRVASGEIDEMVNLICGQRGFVYKIIILHHNRDIREEIKIVKTFSPTTGKITMDIEIEYLLPW